MLASASSRLDTVSRPRTSMRASSPRAPQFGWRRWVVSMGVICALGGFQSAIAEVTDVGPRLALSIILWLLSMPLFMIPLVASFKWAVRRRIGWMLTLLMSLAIAAAVGSLLSVVYCTLLRHQPRMLPLFLPWRGMASWTFSRAAGLGGIWGSSICVLWVLSFAYPFAAEGPAARARGREAHARGRNAAQRRRALAAPPAARAALPAQHAQRHRRAGHAGAARSPPPHRVPGRSAPRRAPRRGRDGDARRRDRVASESTPRSSSRATQARWSFAGRSPTTRTTSSCRGCSSNRSSRTP